ncbi:TIGR02594 family protein [Spongiimicrobium salis]|uniref:TIGR02594 family protein n=1 Tax=Spongiimicrobium salis TaxID=1667022 RepID=UPI00374DF1CF
MKRLALVNIALTQYGITEIRGQQDNPEILKYFNVIGFDGSQLKDETAWCSAFMNWVALEAGCQHTGKLNARSWLDVGERVAEPKIGDVAILWRESPQSWKGHVGIFISEDENNIHILGGNQSNQVNIRTYPKRRLLEFRRI